MRNDSLTAARHAKNDEFYTLREDVEAELGHYTGHFAGKRVYCCCDDPETSEFWHYFAARFRELGLAELTASCLAPAGRACAWHLTDPDGPVVREPLEGDGDFRSPACLSLLDRADIVVTNPPFSLFRHYLPFLLESGAGFLLIGSINFITYKEFFPLLVQDRAWLGVNHPKGFQTPEGEVQKFGNICWFTNLDIQKRHEPLDLSGNAYYGREDRYPCYDNFDAIEVSRVCDIPGDYTAFLSAPADLLAVMDPADFWLLPPADHDIPPGQGLGGKRYGRYPIRAERGRAFLGCGCRDQAELRDLLTSKYGYAPDEIDGCSGVMGVPVTFMDRYSPEQFEIIGGSDRSGDGLLDFLKKPYNGYLKHKAPILLGRAAYKRIFIARRETTLPACPPGGQTGQGGSPGLDGLPAPPEGRNERWRG